MRLKIKLTIVCGLLFLPLIRLQAQSESVSELKMTIKEQKAQIKKLEEEKQTLETKLKKSQKKNPKGNCDELQEENNELKKQNQKLKDNLRMKSHENSYVDKTTLDIKDPQFKAYLLRYCDMDNDGDITTWDAEHTYVINCAKEKKSIIGSVFEEDSPSITNLAGIEAFKNLKVLVCSGNRISKLDLSNNTSLEKLEADGCGLMMLNIYGNKELNKLSCKNNELYDLDLSQNEKLSFLDVNQNKLTILSLNQNPKLTKVNCSQNRLVSIMLSNNAGLKFIDCSDNELNNLDLSKTAVDSVICKKNNLNSLDLRNERNITYVDYSDNRNLNAIRISQGCYVLIDNSKKAVPHIY